MKYAAEYDTENENIIDLRSILLRKQRNDDFRTAFCKNADPTRAQRTCRKHRSGRQGCRILEYRRTGECRGLRKSLLYHEKAIYPHIRQIGKLPRDDLRKAGRSEAGEGRRMGRRNSYFSSVRSVPPRNQNCPREGKAFYSRFSRAAGKHHGLHPYAASAHPSISNHNILRQIP